MAQNTPTGISRHAHLSTPSKEWEDFYNSDPSAVPTLVGSPEELRALMTTLKATAKTKSAIPIIEEGLEAKNHQVPTSDGAKILCRTYVPTSGMGPFPGLVYLHGGGWTLGDAEESDPLCRAICVHASVAVINVEYRLAPEHPFPACLDDAWNSLEWTIKNAEMLKIDTNRLLLGGSSAGGNLAAAITHRARKANVPIHGQILRIPATCHPDAYPPELGLLSLEENKNAPLLSKRSMELFWGYYNPPNPTHVDASPLLAESFEGLPQAFIQVSGADPLRDEGLAYAEKLKEAGVNVRLEIYPGLPHAFNFFPQLSASKKNAADLLEGIKWLACG